MEHADDKKPVLNRSCPFQNCPGQVEARHIVFTVTRRGQTLLIEGVPAEVCDLCGETLLTPATSERIDAILKAIDEGNITPGSQAPVYSFAA